MSRSIAIFDAYWSTAGGGEKYAAGVAETLSAENDVVLLAHEPVDLDWLGERLALDLSNVRVVVIDECDSLEEVTAQFDVLFNLSYRSHGRNGAKRGIYVVHFPDRPGAGRTRLQRFLQNGPARLLRRRNRSFEFTGGFHRPDLIRWQEVYWTNGRGVLRVLEGAGETLRLAFGRYVPGGNTRHIEIVVNGEVRSRVELVASRSKVELVEPLIVDVDLRGVAEGAEIEIHSEADNAHDLLGNGDHRRLGVPLVGVAVDKGLRNALILRASLLDTVPPSLDWLESYDTIVANSLFTHHWINKWWGQPSVVVEPPVGLRVPLEKTKSILSVGRFFADGRGHAKKQVEMVEAFRTLCNDGVEGWTLHLAGGCSPDDLAYLEKVRNAAIGLPIEFHIDVSGAELDELYGQASIYWHATGLGENLDVEPELAEHFGITTVEAMSAGTVPVIFNGGGQPEIVRHGIDGFVYSQVDQLVGFTHRLVTDDPLRRTLALSARERALIYGSEAFTQRVNALLDESVS